MNIPVPAVSLWRARDLFLDDRQRAHFASGVLRWLWANIEQFRPPRPDASGVAALAARKAFGELGGALRIALRQRSLAALPETRDLVAAWVCMADEQAVLGAIEERADLVPTHAAYAAIMGDLRPPACPSVRHRLQQVLARGYVDRVEQSAWKKSELRYYFDAAGLAHQLPEAAALVRASSVARPPQLPYVRELDLYAVTHILFDLADFGARDPGALLGELRQPITDYVGLALSMCLAEQNWDLSAELLMCRIYLGCGAELERWALSRLCAVQHASGYIPASGAPGIAGTEAADFTEAYHPTVVSLFLIAAEARSLT